MREDEDDYLYRMMCALKGKVKVADREKDGEELIPHIEITAADRCELPDPRFMLHPLSQWKLVWDWCVIVVVRYIHKGTQSMLSILEVRRIGTPRK